MGTKGGCPQGMSRLQDEEMEMSMKKPDPDVKEERPFTDEQIAPNLYQWIEKFEACVKNKDYATAKTLFHERAIGASRDGVSLGIDNIAESFRTSWDEFNKFEINKNEGQIIGCGRTYVLLCPYVSKSRLVMGKDRKGCISVTLRLFGLKLLCLHIHTN